MFIETAAGYCNQHVCMSVCLSVCSHISRTTYPYCIPNFIHVTRGRGSVLLWRQCDMLCTSGFVDDVMFPMDGIGQIKDDMYASSSLPGDGTGAKFAVCECILLSLRGDRWRVTAMLTGASVATARCTSISLIDVATCRNIHTQADGPWQRNRATRYVSWNLINCCTAVRKKIGLHEAARLLQFPSRQIYTLAVAYLLIYFGAINA